MKIKVKSLTGKKYDLDVNYSDSIKNIKDLIREKAEIPKEKPIRLIYAGKELDDDKILDDYNISNNSTIHLVTTPKTVKKLYIKINEGKILALDFNPSDTIGNLKEKIKDEEGLDSTQYNLFLDKKLLKENNKTLEEYNISTISLIDLISKGLIQINIVNDKNILIDAKLSDKVGIIKEKIKDKENIIQSRCELIFEGKILEDNKSLDDYNINEESIIYFKYYKQIEIILKINKEKEISLIVELKDTIFKLKQRINNIEGIFPNRYKLKFNEIELDNDEETLEDYDIKNGNIINLYKNDKIQIIEKSTQTKITIKIEYLDIYIDRLKEKIEKKKKIPPTKYKLIFEEQKLEDFHSLYYYGINGNSILFLEFYEKYELLILDGKKEYNLSVESSETLGKIKEKLKSKYQIPTNNYLLEYEGEKLDDYQTLDDLNIEKDTKIILKFFYCPMIQILVKTWLGSTFCLEVETSNTIEYVKKLLEKKNGIKTYEQRLIFAGKTLDDNKTIDYYCIPGEGLLDLVFHLSLRLRG